MDGQEEKPPKIFQIYSTDELFPSNKKTEILSTLKKHKQIDILHFSKRKDEAMKFLNEGNIQKAIEYDNTSYDINRDYSKLIIQNNEILNLFNENLNKNNLQELIKEIINSVQWNEEKIKDKYNEYKNDINNRYKFNQPIDINNTSLYFYNTRIHILFNLLESDNISQFKKKLEKKRKIYNKINIINIIDKNEYPKVKNKLKYLMLILIKADNEEDANYMINSIFSEKENIKECFEEMKKFISNISYNEIEETIFINEIPIKKKFFSFKSILSYIKEFPVYSLYNDYLYNYEYFLESYWINSIYENLKQLIRVIFKSKIYANILNELFKKSQFEIEFIQSDDFIQFLLSKINFIPISTYQIPFLDKLSLDIFLGGRTYEGEFRNIYPSGQGVIIYPNGDRYMGYVSEGKPYSKGSYSWANGNLYEGSFNKGLKSGAGKIYYNNNTYEEGIWNNDIMIKKTKSGKWKFQGFKGIVEY